MIHYFEFWRLKCLFIFPVSKNIQTTGTLKLRRYKRYSPTLSSVKISYISDVSAGLAEFFWVKIFSTKENHTVTRTILLILPSQTDILQSNTCYCTQHCFQTVLCRLHPGTLRAVPLPALKHPSGRSKQGWPNCQLGTYWALLITTAAGNNPGLWKAASQTETSPLSAFNINNC